MIISIIHSGRDPARDGDLDGVDQAPAGGLRRTVHSREALVRPGDITTPAPNRQLGLPQGLRALRQAGGNALLLEGFLKPPRPKCEPEPKIAWRGRECCVPAGLYDRHFASALRPRNPSSTEGKREFPAVAGITGAMKGEAMPISPWPGLTRPPRLPLSLNAPTDWMAGSSPAMERKLRCLTSE